MADRDILDQIDDVITWHGSDDAMRWTAEPPKPPALPIPDEEAMRRFGEQTAGQVQAFLDAFRPAAEQMMRSVGEALRAFAALAPHMQQVEEARRAERRAMRQAQASERPTAMNDAQRIDHLGIDENGEELPDHRERKQGL